MFPNLEIAVVGAGPAGAYCASELAKKGFRVILFDHSHPREKPCGGGITSSVIEKFPWIEKFRSFGQSLPIFRIISCTNKSIITNKLRITFAVSRRQLDEGILRMAIENGAILVKERVSGVKEQGQFFRIRTDNHQINARIVVGADGVNSIVRKYTVGQIDHENIGLGYGFQVTGAENDFATLKFLDSIPGYIWIFPRGNHTNVGIGSESKYGNMFKNLLDEFLHAYYPHTKRNSTFAATMPLVKNPRFFSIPCAGKNWVLVGDAAGHVDPVTGEGILFGLWSGKLAAEAIEKGNPALFESMWRKEYGRRLIERCIERKQFYDPVRLEFMTAIASKDTSSVIERF